ncbi:recombinase family protein [Pseudarthrobacter sp. NS4]|uniref:recombinase family protein n=1 Tax=Pseudarthrobacter sp. NS4 TaxID=2973976 RepID=UPI002162AC1A|nr:recombinase family protein [Pseudarthrobacter sp. NS4]
MGTHAVYVRQSEDKTGHEAAVQRQEADCRLMAQAKGWDGPVLYADNSISATTGKTRPAFERLLGDIDRGLVSGVVVWHLDRLTRSMKDLSRIIDAGQKHRVNIACVHGVSLDLGDATGVAVAQILTAIAAMETKHKGDRQKAANAQRAGKGEAFWSRRPFGYDRSEDGRVFTVPEEADAIKEAAVLVLNGATLSSVVRKWNAAGFRTTAVGRDKKDRAVVLKEGGLWGVTQLRRVLLSERYAGTRTYNGVPQEAAGQWEAILDEETSRRLKEMLTDPRRRTAPDDLNSKYLLSGIVVCGKCGAKMFAAPVPDKAGGKRMVYRCLGGYCMQRSLEQIDALVQSVIVTRLAMPDAARMFATGDTTTDLRSKAQELRDRRDGLASLLAEGIMSVSAVREQAGKLTRALGEIESAISSAEEMNPAAAVIGASNVAEAWSDLPLGTKRQIIRTLLDVSVLPAGKGHGFDPEQIQIEWRA